MILTLLALACAPVIPSGRDSGTAHVDDTGHSSGDDTGHADGVVHDLSWRLHDDIGALVYASWTQDEPGTVHVEYSFDDGVWASTPAFEAEAGAQEQLIAGIPYDTQARWRVVLGDRVQPGEDITTGAVPSGLPLGTVSEVDESQWLPGGNYLLTSINQDRGGWVGGTYWTFIIDRQGRPVWAHKAPGGHWTLFAQLDIDGEGFWWDEATYWSDMGGNGATSTVHHTWLDEEIEERPTPGLHHTFVQLPDGTLAWGSQDDGGGEALVEMGPGETEHTVIWTCRGDWPGVRDCESNGLFYSPSRDTYLYSFYTNNSLVEVDRSTGQSLWWAGEVPDGYSFDPPGAQFSWQHGVSWTDTGTLLLSTYSGHGGGASTPVYEYEVDEDAGVLHLVWQFDSGHLADTNGDAWRLSNGNTLDIVGSAGHVYEVNPDAEVVWHVDFNGNRLMGRGEFIDDLYDLVKPR